MRLPLLLAPLALAAAGLSSANPPRLAEGCEELPAEVLPVRYDVSFEGDIRPLLEDSEQACTICHGSSGDLSLSFGSAHAQLLGADGAGAPSAGDTNTPPMLRVKPGEPLASSLFVKLNCDVPPFGGRMPLGGSPNAELQALVHDWIASGALMPNSPGGLRLFVAGFETIRRPAP